MKKIESLEVVVGELAHVVVDEVVPERDELVVVLHLESEREEGQQHVDEDEIRIEVQLRADVRRMLDALALPEEVLVVERPQQEGVLAWQAERVELVLVVHQLHRALAVGVRGGRRERGGGALGLAEVLREVVGALRGNRHDGLGDLSTTALEEFAQHFDYYLLLLLKLIK